MTLANPAGLWFLLAAVPIIAIHLLKPRRAESVVSSSMLWQADTVGSTAASLWQRIPPSLLLLLQLLLVALGALLLANPVTRSEAGLAEHTVVVLDTSASMGAIDGGPDRFADAKAEAIQVTDDLPAGGRISLVSAGPTPRVHVTATTDYGAFEAAVRAVPLSDGPANLIAAMSLADGLETPDARLGIVLISDGGHTPDEQAALPAGVTHRLVGESDVNHAITSLDVKRVEGGIEATAVSEITGGGEVQTAIRFDVDDLTQAVQDVTLRPGVPTVTTVLLPEGEQVIARLGGDDLLAVDNTAYALTRSRDDLKVSVHGTPDPFLNTLLESLAGVEIVDPEIDAPDVSIFVEVPVPEDTTRPFIAIAPIGGAPGVTVTGVVENPIVALVRSSDSLLTGLDLTRLRIASAQQVESTTAQVLVGAEGAPLILRGSRGGIPFVYQSFLVSDSTLPIELAFPVLGQRMLEELGGSVTIPSSLEVGDPIVPPVGRDATITSPNGTVRVRPTGSGAIPADRPGFWTLEPAGGGPRLIAVSPNRGESDLAPLPIAPTDPRPLRPGEEPLTADSSWRWLIAIPLVVLGVLEFLVSRRRRGVPQWQWRAASGLRLASIAALVAALLGASIPLRTNDVATVFVLDRSDSVGRLGANQGLNLVQQAVQSAPDDALLGVVVSADGSRVEQLLIDTDRSRGQLTAAIDGDRSDLASGLRFAGALLPDDTKRRVVIVSDGRATAGDVEAEAQALGERGIPVDYMLLEPAEGADAAVVSVDTPTIVDEGTDVPIDVTIESTTEQPALVTLRRDGEPVATVETLLRVGNNRVSFTDAPGDTGLAVYTVTVDTEGDARPQNNTGRTTVEIDGVPRVLLIEGTEAAGDALAVALESTGVVVDIVEPEETPSLERLVGYDATILANVSIDQLSADQVDSIVTATRELGRGLLTIGGPQAYGMGSYRDTNLEEVLPVISDVLDPQRQRKVAQVMALDTSESMGECHCAEGFENRNRDLGGVRKTDIARAGAARAIDTLSDIDEVGVIAVDTNERWLIDLQQLPSNDVIESGLARAVPSGNTELSGTLPAAAEALRASDAALKHVILFTDGFTSQGDLQLMAEQAAELFEEGITVSVVGTGEGAARELERVADAGGGRFYPGRDLLRIPEILVQESILASRQFINEGEFLPLITDTSPVVDNLTESPPLLGFVATTAKPTARTALRIGPEQDPLLSSWQIGLGRASSWTSDANPRWSQNWVDWDGYVDFWDGVVRDTFPIDSGGAVRTTVDGDTLRIRAEAEPGQGRITAVVSSPNGNQSEVRLREVSPGVFEGTASADSAGTYAVGVSIEGDGETKGVGSNIASVSYAAEYRPGPADEALLQRVSDVSGGRGAITPSQVFDNTGLTAGRRSISLVPWFLLAAALAWLAAAILSRLWLSRGRRRIAVPAAATAERVHTPRSRRAKRVPDAETPSPSRRVSAGSKPEPTSTESFAPPAASATPKAPAEPASAATVNELLKARREKRGE